MSSPKPTDPPPVKLDYVAAVLSYLIPGLGQLTQGRVRKGLLFLGCLYALFFYGMYLGKFQNVYLPDNHPEERGTVARLASDLYTRFQFVGQFPIGMAAWPATSGKDPRFDTTTGTPHAIASRTGKPNPSSKEGRTSMAASR